MEYIIVGLAVILGLLFPRNRFVSFFLLVIDWVLFAFSTGNADWLAYQAIYRDSAWSIKTVHGFYGNIEIGFQILCSFCRDILHLDYVMFRGVILTLTLMLFFFTIKRYTRNTAMVLSLFTIFPLLISGVQIRSWIAFCIVFWAIRYLEADTIKGMGIYVAWVFLAMSVQVSSIAYLLFLLCKFNDEKRLRRIIAIWCIVGRFFVLELAYRITSVRTHLIQYLNATSIVTQIMMLIIMITIYVLAVVSRKLLRQRQDALIYQGYELAAYERKQIVFADMTVKISIVIIATWPFTAVTIEIIRFVRYVLILGYVTCSILSGRRKIFDLNVALLKICITILSISLLIYFCCRGEFMEIVFLPGFRDNSMMQFLF